MIWDDLVPEVTLRPAQREALDGIARVFDDGRRVCMLQAPTGVGKSVVLLAMARYLGGGYIATPQRVLQDQMSGWPDIAIMKGRSSYRCALVPGVTADAAPCVRSRAIMESHDECGVGSCPFYTAVDTAQRSKIVVHNYASLMSQSRISELFNRRRLLCLDEGHTAVDWIRNFATIDVTNHDLGTAVAMDPPGTAAEVLPWIRTAVALLDGDIPTRVSDDMVGVLLKFSACGEAYGAVDREDLERLFSESDAHGSSHEWGRRALTDALARPTTPWDTAKVMEDDVERWKCTPLRSAPLSGLLTGLGERVLISTATVLDPRLMALELGIDEEDYAMVDVQEAFAPDRRPIVLKPVGSMSFTSSERTLPALAAALAEIIRRHDGEQGIVHTVSYALSYKLLERLTRALPNVTIIVPPRGGRRESTVQAFLRGEMGPNSVLMGPALLEGIDAVGDSARWQAMCKVPWPHRKDPVVSYLLDSPNPRVREWGNRWYGWKAVQQTVQGIGRVCRGPEDFGITYLLDSGFARIMSSPLVPDYVRAAITEES